MEVFGYERNLSEFFYRQGQLGTCLLDNCPYIDTIMKKVKAKTGVDVIEGTHPYKPVKVFEKTCNCSQKLMLGRFVSES